MTFILSSCCRPLLSTPRFDPSPVLSLGLSEHVDSLSAIPRTETFVEDGINKSTERQQPDDIKEMFELDIPDGKIYFTLYFNTMSAGEGYKSNMKSETIGNPVFSESGNDVVRGYVRYVEQPRCDYDLCYEPKSYYTSRCGFQLQNIVIQLSVAHDEKESESLNQAIKNLATLLISALSPDTTFPNHH